MVNNVVLMFFSDQLKDNNCYSLGERESYDSFGSRATEVVHKSSNGFAWDKPFFFVNFTSSSDLLKIHFYTETERVVLENCELS